MKSNSGDATNTGGEPRVFASTPLWADQVSQVWHSGLPAKNRSGYNKKTLEMNPPAQNADISRHSVAYFGTA